MSDLKDSGLEVEYDEVFDGEDKSLNMLRITSDKFTRTKETVKIKEIALSEAIKKGRFDTMIGLTKSIGELGVVTPIHVMTMEQYDEEEEGDFKYMLIDGLRRTFGALKNGNEEIDAVVWDFKDKDLGRQVALALSLLVNRAQKRTWKEVWDLYQILELQSSVTPGTLEYLLQLEPGDAMRLKDCMLCDYSEVKEMVLGGEKSLSQCYNQLQKLRKEENALAKEELTGIADTVDGAGEIASEEGDSRALSDDEVRDLLEMGSGVSDLSDADLDIGDLDMSADVRGVDTQKVGERHPIDPAIRQSTFQRDGFECRCCETGGVAFLGTLIYHHLIPVSCSGPDTVDNGLTLCDSCHQILHIYQQGKLAMSKDQFEGYTKTEQRRIRLIMKYGNIAIEAGKRKGMSKEDVREANKSSLRHRMPGENLGETKAGFATSGKVES